MTPVRQRRPLVPRFLIAIAVVLVVAALHFEIDRWFGDNSAFLPFTLAVLVVVLWVGTRPALLATFLALLLGIGFSGRYDSSPAATAFAALTFGILSGGIIFLANRIGRSSRRAAREARKANENHLRSILSTVPEAMIVIDEAGAILSFSTTAETLFGHRQEEVLGRNIRMLMPSPDKDNHDGYIARYLRTGERHIIGSVRTVFAQRKDFSIFPVELSVGEAVGEDGRRIFTGFIRDLTERRHTEEKLASLQAELIHVSRVGAMGAMASTLAHELNQPITAVVNYVEGVRDILQRPNGARLDMPVVLDALDDAAREALRAGTILRHLRDFVARGEVEKSVEALPQLVREAADFGLMGAREKGVDCSFDLSPEATPVLVDKVQIQQVLINLIRNATEAMVDRPERQLSITTAPDPHPGFVRVSISDTGPGVAPEVARQLFSAFVSTKTKGMGLGLSICRTIIEANGGRIWMEPRKNGGTLFHFTLMRANMDGQAERDS